MSLATTQAQHAPIFNPSDKGNGTLDTLHAVWLTREEWTFATLKVPSGRSNGFLSKAQLNPALLYRADKEDVRQTILDLADSGGGDRDLDQLSLVVDEQLNLSHESFTRLDEKRKGTGSGKAGAVLQSLLVSFGNFLEAYTGIAELLKAADNQYGGLAYGTISLLLSVAVHKQKREDSFVEGFEEIGFAFPRLKTLQELEPTQTLKFLIGSAFAKVIDFCREATAYYANRWERFKGALSPTAQKMKTLSEIRKLLKQTREEMDLIMFRRIVTMQQSLSRAESMLQQAKSRNERRDKDEQERHLVKLRKLLSVTFPCPHTSTAAYKALLGQAFDIKGAKQDLPFRITWNLIREDRSFHEWWMCEESCFLLLGGVNWTKSGARTLNWLSHASVLAEEQLKDQGSHVAFFYCQNDWTMRNRCTLPQVVKSLVYQLAACLRGQLTRNTLSEIEDCLESSDWYSGDGECSIQAIISLLKVPLSYFSSEDQVILIIDRLDQFRWEGEEDYFGPGWLPFVLQCLLDLAQEAQCRLKILLVVDGSCAQRIAAAQIDLGHAATCLYLQKLNWMHETERERARRAIESA